MLLARFPVTTVGRTLNPAQERFSDAEWRGLAKASPCLAGSLGPFHVRGSRGGGRAPRLPSGRPHVPHRLRLLSPELTVEIQLVLTLDLGLSCW